MDALLQDGGVTSNLGKQYGYAAQPHSPTPERLTKPVPSPCRLSPESLWQVRFTASCSLP